MHYNRQEFITVVAQRIKALRAERGWTQIQMTRDFGYHLSHWQNIESGRTMSLETMLRVANTFEVTVDELVYGIRRRMGPGFGSRGFHEQPDPKKTVKKAAKKVAPKKPQNR